MTTKKEWMTDRQTDVIKLYLWINFIAVLWAGHLDELSINPLENIKKVSHQSGFFDLSCPGDKKVCGKREFNWKCFKGHTHISVVRVKGKVPNASKPLSGLWNVLQFSFIRIRRRKSLQAQKNKNSNLKIIIIKSFLKNFIYLLMSIIVAMETHRCHLHPVSAYLGLWEPGWQRVHWGA